MFQIWACRNYDAKTEHLSWVLFAYALTAAMLTGGTATSPPYADETVIAGQGTIGRDYPSKCRRPKRCRSGRRRRSRRHESPLALLALTPTVTIVEVEIRRDRYTISDGIAVKQPDSCPRHPRRSASTRCDRFRQRSSGVRLLLDRVELVGQGAERSRVRGAPRGTPGGSGPALCPLCGTSKKKNATMLIFGDVGTASPLQGRYLVVRHASADRPGS